MSGYKRAWYDEFYKGDPAQTQGPWYAGAWEFLSRLEGQSLARERVLEVGCGNGEFLSRLSARQVVGIDPSAEACKLTAERGASAATAEGERLPFKNSIFDVVLCLEVLEHVASPPQVMSEINRVLRAQGLLIVSSPNYYNVGWLLLRLAADVFNRPQWILRQPRDRLTTISTISRLLRQFGFRRVGAKGYVLEPPGVFHWRRAKGRSPLMSDRMTYLAFHPVSAARKHRGVA